MIIYQKNQGRNEWVSFDAEMDALKIYSTMEKLGWTSALYNVDMQLIKNAGHMPASFQILADKASKEKFHYFTSSFDANGPYFVGWLGEEAAIDGQVFLTYEDAEVMMRSLYIPHAVYDINANPIGIYGMAAANWEDLNDLAKRKLMPFQLDSVLLTMIGHMEEKQLDNAYEKFAQGDSPMLTNLKRRVIKDDAIAPFILVWQRFEGITESNLFTNKPDSLREFTWMKMLGRDVALYDYESSLLEKSADEDLVLEFDAFAEN